MQNHTHQKIREGKYDTKRKVNHLPTLFLKPFFCLLIKDEFCGQCVFLIICHVVWIEVTLGSIFGNAK